MLHKLFHILTVRRDGAQGSSGTEVWSQAEVECRRASNQACKPRLCVYQVEGLNHTLVFLFTYLFSPHPRCIYWLQRGGGEETDVNVRETWVRCLQHTPNQGHSPQTRYVSWPAIKPVTFPRMGDDAPTNRVTPSRHPGHALVFVSHLHHKVFFNYNMTDNNIHDDVKLPAWKLVFAAQKQLFLCFTLQSCYLLLRKKDFIKFFTI